MMMRRALAWLLTGGNRAVPGTRREGRSQERLEYGEVADLSSGIGDFNAKAFGNRDLQVNLDEISNGSPLRLCLNRDIDTQWQLSRARRGERLCVNPPQQEQKPHCCQDCLPSCQLILARTLSRPDLESSRHEELPVPSCSLFKEADQRDVVWTRGIDGNMVYPAGLE